MDELKMEVRGSKKRKALMKLLELTGGRNIVIGVGKLTSLMIMHANMGLSYAVRVISELSKIGVLRRVEYGVYEVDAEKLRRVLEGGE